MDTHGDSVERTSDGRSARPLRVVIVEDSQRIRARLEEALLEIDNLTIAGEAATEAEALSLLTSRPWDFAILDLQLRQGNGLGLLKAIGK
jgi:DNA-binding NarL/FixJ family response regulator